MAPGVSSRASFTPLTHGWCLLKAMNASTKGFLAWFKRIDDGAGTAQNLTNHQGPSSLATAASHAESDTARQTPDVVHRERHSKVLRVAEERACVSTAMQAPLAS